MEEAKGLKKSLKLNNGTEIPTIGYGTYLSLHEDLFLNAVECGYRHIDTATIYGNEDKVGLALKSILDKGEIKREELYITTKI